MDYKNVWQLISFIKEKTLKSEIESEGMKLMNSMNTSKMNSIKNSENINHKFSEKPFFLRQKFNEIKEVYFQDVLIFIQVYYCNI